MNNNSQANGPRSLQIVSAIIVVSAVIFLAISALPLMLKHGGPQRLHSLGYVRFSSCTYKGEFIGGIGFDCVVRNYADELRLTRMSCGSYDDQDRLIGRPDTVGALTNTLLRPGEERIVRIYGAENGSTIVCSETGDFPPPPLEGAYNELADHGIASTLDL